MARRVDGRYTRSARITPANAITMARLLATPVMVVLVVALGPSWTCLVAWVLLASTDFLDGWVARREGPTTSGAFLDPLADKALVLGALVALAASGRVGWLAVALVGGREVAMSAYRSRLLRTGISVPARPLAKAKTATQDLAVGLVLLPEIGRHHATVGRDVLWVAVLLGLVSFAQYLLDSRAPEEGSEVGRVGGGVGGPLGGGVGGGVGGPLGGGVGGPLGGAVGGPLGGAVGGPGRPPATAP